jgi:hypothetical protein
MAGMSSNGALEDETTKSGSMCGTQKSISMPCNVKLLSISILSGKRYGENALYIHKKIRMEEV